MHGFPAATYAGSGLLSPAAIMANWQRYQRTMIVTRTRVLAHLQRGYPFDHLRYEYVHADKNLYYLKRRKCSVFHHTRILFVTRVSFVAHRPRPKWAKPNK
jgi:hypothetical protein